MLKYFVLTTTVGAPQQWQDWTESTVEEIVRTGETVAQLPIRSLAIFNKSTSQMLSAPKQYS